MTGNGEGPALAGETRLPVWARDASMAGLRVVERLPDSLPETVATLIDEDIASEFSVVPLGRDGGRLTLATASGRHALARMGELEFALGPVELVAAEPASVHALIARHYAAKSIPALDEPRFDESSAYPNLPIETAARSPGLTSYVNSVLSYAFRIGASDIHFEPVEDAFRIRMRVDGTMRSMPDLPQAAGHAIVARLKVMAGVDIGISRRAQDGRIRMNGRDLRLATLPCIAGECAVVRVLDASKHDRSLNELGMPEACIRELDIVCRGQGLVISCGPTGSGKTTTLHSILCGLDATARKILTIEDPVEYELAGAVQVPARPEIGLSFARALRSFLRHDPDIILIGEIRDVDTARIAMQAALTGHLVLASLHCRNAVETPLRLMELGVEPWLVGSALTLSVAQRLVRKTCKSCGGVGCRECLESGYAGRTAIFEWLRMSIPLASLLDEGRIADYVGTASACMPVTMALSGMALVNNGVTTRAEIAAQVDLPG